jgi:YfiH family protein
MSSDSYLIPDWDVPPTVHAAMTLRQGGVSLDNYSSLNPATHVEDTFDTVLINRQRIKKILALPSEPIWLNQTHSTLAIQADIAKSLTNADASFTSKIGIVCTILTADCLPILLCSTDGVYIAAIHAGWRGLLAGIISNTLKAMQTRQLSVWLGAAIGRCCFEVGMEVRELFIAKHPQFSVAFTQKSSQKYLADIYQLARIELNINGVNNIYGGEFCTVCDPQRFYSYRRDQQTGRMATLIWKD